MKQLPNSVTSNTSNRFRSHSMFYTLLLLVTITAVISVFSFATYRQVCNRLKNIAISEAERELQQSTDNITTSFHYAWETFSNSSVINDLSQIFSYSSEDGQLTHGELLLLSRKMKNYYDLGDCIQDVGLFISGTTKDYWCSVSVISDDFKRDYEYGLFSFNDIPYDSYRDIIYNNADSRIMRRDFCLGYVCSNYSASYAGQMICLSYPVTVTANSLKIYAIMLINVDSIQEKLLSSRYTGSYFGLYSRGSLIYSTDPEIDFSETSWDLYHNDSTNTYYIRNFIDELGLTCYISLDSDKMYSAATPFSHMLSLMFIVLAIGSGILICFLFWNWLIPIVKIADALPFSTNERNAVKRINHHLHDLSSRNMENQDKLIRYQKNNLIKDIFLGKNFSIQKDPVLSELAPIKEGIYRCICISSLAEDERYLFTLESIVEKIEDLSITSVAHTVIDNIFSCLVIQDKNDIYADSQAFFESLNKLLSIVNCNAENHFAIGVSDVYTGTDSISTAYREARKNWQYALLWQNTAVVFTPLQHSNNYSVNYTQLDSMYRAIVTNCKDNVLKIFDELVENNFGDGMPTKQRALYFQQFTMDILGVLVRVSTQYDIHAIIESYLSDNTLVSFQRRIKVLREAIVESCEFIPTHDYDEVLINAIFEYCKEHYADSQLSISLLADQFHLSKSSISKYFKAYSGVNFSVYIERLRIQQAEKLISENKLPIRKIAEKVGYQNIKTFYNAFRKIEKCTPTEWRQQKELINE